MNKFIISVGFISLFIFEACQREKFTQGKRIYDVFCLQCHMEDGSGLGSLYPTLVGSAYLAEKLDELPCLIRNGKISTQLKNIVMPEHKSFKEAEMSNLVNYLSHKWGDQKNVPITTIRSQMELCP